MSGWTQRARWMCEWRAAGEPEWHHNFIPAGPYSRRVRCKVCGSLGYDGWPFGPYPWQVNCLIGHRYTCETCGARCNNLGIHQTCKQHHACCRDHLDTNHRALQRLLLGEAATGEAPHP